MHDYNEIVSEWLQEGGQDIGPTKQLDEMGAEPNQLVEFPPLIQPRTGRRPSSTALKSRPRLYGDYLLKGYLTSLISPGGVGKSVLMMTMFSGIAVGRDLLGLADVTRSRKVLMLNNEDSEAELDLRIAAVAKAYRFSEAEENLFADNYHDQSGYTQKIKIASKVEDVIVRTGVVNEIVHYCQVNEIEAVGLDPMVSLHDAGENDNVAMDEVISILRQIGAEAGVGILFAHHARKGSEAETPDDNSRGATSVIAGVRANYGLAKMSKDEAKKFILPEDSWMDMMRLDHGKRNYAQNARDATWFELKSTPLDALHWETEEATTEWVGVPVPAELQMKKKDDTGWNLHRIVEQVLLSQIDSPFITSGPTGDKLREILSDTKKPIGDSALASRMKSFPALHDGASQVAYYDDRYNCWKQKNPDHSNRWEYHYKKLG